jgi:predicted DNA-binding WGR domain protein
VNRLFKVKVDNQTFNRSVRNTLGFSDEPQLVVHNNPNKDVVNVNYKLDEEKTKLLRDNGCTLYDETLKKPFMAALDSIDVDIGKNSFYKIEIIHSNAIYYLYRTYGRIGTEFVKSNLNEFIEKESAVKKFCELYLEKTGNKWKDSSNFEKKSGKYFQVDMDNGSMEEGHLEHAIDWARLGQIKLDAKVKEVISSLFNVEKMEADLKEFKVSLTRAFFKII